MDYAEAVETAPPGWRHFSVQDIERLPEDVQAKELARIPPDEPDDRVLRAMFWTLVYHLEPERWDELARFAPIHPDLIAAIPGSATTAVAVGAASGRLTAHLARRSRQIIAVEPSQGLRSILMRRLPGVRALD